MCCGHGDGCRGEIGAQRIKAAMSDIENFQHAKHEGQAKCDDKQPRGLDEAIRP